jgi:DNA-binding HxlR family transcriptional regulator
MPSDAFDALMTSLQRHHGAFDCERLTSLAKDIAANGHQREDPVREIMSRLGDRWSALLLSVLSTGSFRHSALRRVICTISAEKAISQRMLTLRLRALERDGLVMRDITDSVPPSVSYRLTPLGVALSQRLAEMICWIKESENTIIQARREFDRIA